MKNLQTMKAFFTNCLINTNSVFLFIFLFIGMNMGWGQGNESFINLPITSSSSYNSRSWNGDDNVTWIASGARTDQTLNGKSICFGTTGTRNVISPTYSGGIGTLSFSYVRGFTGTTSRAIEVYINNNKIGSTISVNANNSIVASYSQVINISGSVVVEIRSTGSGQVLVDDISWTSYSNPPSILASPTTTSAFSSISGTASTSQTFSVSGSNLTSNIIATAPTGFEVSSDGTTYNSSASFTQSGGTASGILYIRLSATAVVGSYNSKNIVLSSTGATDINITTPATGNTVTSTSSNNCPSGNSTAPTSEQTVCQDISTSTIATTVSYSGVTGTPTDLYQWYYNTTNSNTISGATAVSGATSASFSPPSSSNEVGTRYYFCVAYATDNSCAQTATTQSLASSTVKIVVNGTPAAPSGTASQSMCTGQSVANLNATGTAIKWYSASSGGSALNSSLALSSTDYYASQTVNGCESSNRLAVAVTVNSIPAAPTGSSTQTFCSGKTVNDLTATGTAIQWYTASTGGSALGTSSALSSTNYYASQTVSGCESSNRFAVAATVNSISIPTNLVSSNANCSSFDLSWDAVNCASGYKLDVASNSFLTTVNQTLINNSGLINSSGWTETNITQASGYISMLSNSSSIITPTIDLSNAVNSNLNFKIRTFGGTSGSSNVVTISISTDNGSSWTTLGTRTAGSNVLTSVTSINLSSNNSSQTKLRFQTLNATGSIGVGIDDIIVDKDVYSPNYVSGYQDLSVSSNSKSVSGLSPNTKYYYRVRSNDGTNTTASSIVDSITTPALSLTTDGIIVPFCFGTATSSSLTYTAANDNPNSYSIDWNATANSAGLNDQAATSFTASASGGTISSIAISSNLAAGTYNGVMTITNTAGCSITKNVSLIINALPTITIAASPSSAIVCTGSNVSLTASGASTYSWSGGISNGSSFSVTTPTSYTVTGTDANGCSATASKTVNYFPASSNVVLASSSVSGAVEQCTESDGYTYYADPASPGQYLFGIDKNGYNFTATVNINVDNVNKYIKSTSSNGANQEHASYTLSRYWNVTTTGTVGAGIRIRFFVNPQDIIDMQNARIADYNSLKSLNPNTLAVEGNTENFKTVGTSYNPSSWTGNRFNGTILKLTEDAVDSLNGHTYVELSGISSFSGGTIGTSFGPSSNNLFNSGGIVGLPVTWKEVNASAKEIGNQIQWITSSEKNTKSFEVEYSYDAKNFMTASRDIIAAGNSTTSNSYEYTHLEEFGEMVYYRIKQIDRDGKIDYSKIVNVKRSSKLPEFHVSMYPIPLNTNELNLKIQTVQKTEIVININDLLGRSVYTEKVSPQGYITNHKLTLDHLQKGTYQVMIDNGINKSVQILMIGK